MMQVYLKTRRLFWSWMLTNKLKRSFLICIDSVLVCACCLRWLNVRYFELDDLFFLSVANKTLILLIQYHS